MHADVAAKPTIDALTLAGGRVLLFHEALRRLPCAGIAECFEIPEVIEDPAADLLGPWAEAA